MRPIAALITCSLGLAVAPTAHSAEVTDMPPALRGDVTIDYAGQFLFGSLSEGGETFGRRRISSHDVVYSLEFAPTDGLSFAFRVDTTPWTGIRFTDPAMMTYDPVADGGTYEGSTALGSSPEINGRGMAGIWLGVAAAPFAEWFKEKHHATWRLDIAFRSPNAKHTLWTYEGDGRGSAPGGSAWLLKGAFSRDNGVANPYLVGSVHYEGRAVVDIVDESGVTHATGATVRPASRFDTRAGVELIGGENRETGERFAFDLFMSFGYRSWADVASGVLLPHVLDQTRGVVVTESDHLTASGGLGLDYHANEYFGARLGTEVRYLTPHQIESPYPVLTGADTLQVSIVTSIEGRLR